MLSFGGLADIPGRQTTRFHPDRGKQATFEDTLTARRSVPPLADERASLAPIHAYPSRLDQLPARRRRAPHTHTRPYSVKRETSPPAIGWKGAVSQKPAAPLESQHAVRDASA